MLSIPEYFKGKNVFITGGTGFMGKVLIEKILRSCPNIDTIYLLIRNKRGKIPQDRIKNITDDQLFGPLKEQNPLAISKLKAIAGNIDELKLGLSEEDEKFLISRVNIIYHCAATVNFDTPLKKAVITNARSAREMAQFALKCEHLEVVVHMSTMYSNCNIFNIDEKMYPPVANWRDIIEVAEDKNAARNIELLTQKYIEPFPNTYTFTKKLAEEAFADICKDKVSLIILRPSIVCCTMDEPLPGWVDNFNGPFSLIIAMCKGITDCSYGDRESVLDKVAVDNVIKATLIATWKKYKDNPDLSQPTIYNICSDVLWKLKDYCNCKELFWTLPLEDRLTFNNEGDAINVRVYFFLWFTIFNVIPAIFVDLLLRLMGRKPILLKVLRKFYLANTALTYFMVNTFTFHNDKYMHIEDDILESDRKAFTFRANMKTDKTEMAKLAIIGIKKYLLNEKYPIAPETFANTKKLYIYHYTIYYLRIFLVLYLLLWRWNIPGLLYNKMYNYVENL